jgi:hypothetical protein
MENFGINENKTEFQQIMEKLEQIESTLEVLTGNKDNLQKDKLLDNADLCAILGITKRSLQRYRQNGVLPYYMLHGKPYYKKSEVQECLKRILNDRNKPKNK